MVLALKNITYRIAGRTLLDNASLSVPSGYRVGLVGPNGAGKSTIFNLISGALELDGGEIELMANVKMGMVRQDLPDDDTTLLDIVLNADTERAALLLEAETVSDPNRITEIYTRLDDIGAYEAPANAAIILSGLGFSDEAQNSPISSFSGGWRMRVALAAALFLKPDLLLLDEPTNHLDFEAIIWLENYLMEYPGTFIIISHDREILNKTVTHIAHLDQLGIELYTGNYDQFEIRRSQKMLSQQALFDKQQAHKKRMMSFVTRFGAKASKAKQAQSRLKAIERMDMVDALIAERSVAFKFPQPEQLNTGLITLRKASVGYIADKPVLKNLNLHIDMEDRIALLGANGNGKSTLIKLLSDKLALMDGDMTRNSKLRVGYFAQHQQEELDIDLTAYQSLRNAIENVEEPKLRAMLGKFGFNKAKADTKITELSGGEKARLLFCMMSHNAPHIMLLDEPTNHLDIDARAALIQALNDYEGCVIIVSHDPHLVESVADQLWLVKDGAVSDFNGDLAAYQELVMEQRRRERSGTKKEKKGKNLKQLDKEIKKLTREKDVLEIELSSPRVLNQPKLLTEANEKYAEILKNIEAVESEMMQHYCGE